MLNKCHFSNIKALPHNPGNGISVCFFFFFINSAQFKSCNLTITISVIFWGKRCKNHILVLSSLITTFGITAVSLCCFWVSVCFCLSVSFSPLLPVSGSATVYTSDENGDGGLIFLWSSPISVWQVSQPYHHQFLVTLPSGPFWVWGTLLHEVSAASNSRQEAGPLSVYQRSPEIWVPWGSFGGWWGATV